MGATFTPGAAAYGALPPASRVSRFARQFLFPLAFFAAPSLSQLASPSSLYPEATFASFVPAEARVYAPAGLVLPNATLLWENFSQLVHASLQGLTNRTGLVNPLFWAVNGTIAGGEFGTLVANQSTPLPMLDDLFCNPQYFPNGCSALGDVGAAVGLPILRWYEASLIGQLQRAIGNAILHGYNRGTRGITPSLVLWLQQDARVAGTVGSLRRVLVPLFAYQEPTALKKLLFNATSLLLWDVLDRLGDEENVGVEYAANTMREQRKAALACRVFNNRLPFCSHPRLLTTPMPPARVVVPGTRGEGANETLTRRDPGTGFREVIIIDGVARSCEEQQKCNIGGVSSSPEQFDGEYYLVGRDDMGFPVYLKPNVKFKSFRGVSKLYLKVMGYTSPRLPQGVTMLVAANRADLSTINVGAKEPFLALLGPVPACGRASDFPLCGSGVSADDDKQRGWFFVRTVSQGCPVPKDPLTNFCALPLNITIV